MCTKSPASNTTDIYNKLIAVSSFRRSNPTAHRTANEHHKLPISRYPGTRFQNTNTQLPRSPRPSTIRSYTRTNSTSHRKLESSDRDSSCLEIKITRVNKDNTQSRKRPECPNAVVSPMPSYAATEVYDDDMMSVWSSFDLKSYDLEDTTRRSEGGPRSEPPLRVKSAPPTRQQFRCNTATLMYTDKQEPVQRPHTGVRRNKQKHKVFQYVIQKNITNIATQQDYDLFLQALKLENCIPPGMSDRFIRKNVSNMMLKEIERTKYKC